MNLARSAFAALLIATCTAASAAFPDKPIRLVIGFPAGGPLDQHARLLSDRLQAVLGQPVLVDYKSGAGGTVGAQEVMKAAPDAAEIRIHTLKPGRNSFVGAPDAPSVEMPRYQSHKQVWALKIRDITA